jgi:ABC-2 type transport system ATP-binding protein
MTPAQVEEHLPHIVEASEITISLDRYLGATPSLVRQKLAWSIAMSVDAHAYAIDRTIVVGDATFREQCWSHVHALREQGASFIVATDAPRRLRRFCSRGVVVSDGRIVVDASMDEAVAAARELRQTSRRSGEDPA